MPTWSVLDTPDVRPGLSNLLLPLTVLLIPIDVHECQLLQF